MDKADIIAEKIFGGLLGKVTVENAAKEIRQYTTEVSRDTAEAAYNDGYNNGYDVNFYNNEPIDFEVWWEYWQKLSSIGRQKQFADTIAYRKKEES